MRSVKYVLRKVETEEYVRIQEESRERIILEDALPERVETMGGADQSFLGDKKVRSCIVVLGFPGLQEVERASAEVEIDFPYIPGLLAFREGPPIIEAYRRLKKKPDVLLVDGHGIAHPRRMGLATNVGIGLNAPTIGVAKKKLVGEYTQPKHPGDYSLLRHEGDIIGVALKTARGCNPIFISPGHMVSLYTAMLLVEKCLRGHKLPEPLRLAHNCVNER